MEQYIFARLLRRNMFPLELHLGGGVRWGYLVAGQAEACGGGRPKMFRAEKTGWHEFSRGNVTYIGNDAGSLSAAARNLSPAVLKRLENALDTLLRNLPEDGEHALPSYAENRIVPEK